MFSGFVLVFVFLLIFSNIARCHIINGNFEQTEPNDFGADPTGWTTQNYARVHSSFTPVFERGQKATWHFEDNTIVPYSGEKFLVLSTGDMGADHLTTFGLAMQACQFEAGKTVMGRYFFGTGDYLGWNDYAEIKLIPVDPNDRNIRSILVEYVDVAQVGDYGSTNGWIPFSHTFTEEDEGYYYLTFAVYDKIDAIFKSYLAIDHVETVSLPPGGDFNADGKVDNLDLAIFFNALYQDCEDPNSICTYIDAAGNERSFDYTGDGLVTPADAAPLIKNWLWNRED